MGTRLIQLVQSDPALQPTRQLDRGGSSEARRGCRGGSPESARSVCLEQPTLESPVDVVIDFSLPGRDARLRVDLRRTARCRWSSGTTGFEPEQRRAVEAYASSIPILIASNFSKAVNLLMRLAGEAAKALGNAADIEIVERHHHFKKDAPSGTALRLAEVVGQAIASNRFVHGREGQVGERSRGEIGLHALRGGDNPGEHTIVFGLMGECLELSHRALNRDGFALGALDAAKFLAGKPPRLYTMNDLLGPS